MLRLYGLVGIQRGVTIGFGMGLCVLALQAPALSKPVLRTRSTRSTVVEDEVSEPSASKKPARVVVGQKPKAISKPVPRLVRKPVIWSDEEEEEEDDDDDDTDTDTDEEDTRARSKTANIKKRQRGASTSTPPSVKREGAQEKRTPKSAAAKSPKKPQTSPRLHVIKMRPDVCKYALTCVEYTATLCLSATVPPACVRVLRTMIYDSIVFASLSTPAKFPCVGFVCFRLR